MNKNFYVVECSAKIMRGEFEVEQNNNDYKFSPVENGKTHEDTIVLPIDKNFIVYDKKESVLARYLKGLSKEEAKEGLAMSLEINREIIINDKNKELLNLAVAGNDGKVFFPTKVLDVDFKIINVEPTIEVLFKSLPLSDAIEAIKDKLYV